MYRRFLISFSYAMHYVTCVIINHWNIEYNIQREMTQLQGPMNLSISSDIFVSILQ